MPISNKFGVFDVHDADVNDVPSTSNGIPSDEADLERPCVSNTVAEKVCPQVSGASSGISSGEADLVRSSGSNEVADKVGSDKPSSSSTPSVAATKLNNPFIKVGAVVCSDSDDDEVLEPVTSSYLASGGGGYDYEDFVDDDYDAQVYDLPGHLAKFCDMYDINLQGRGRK